MSITGTTFDITASPLAIHNMRLIINEYNRHVSSSFPDPELFSQQTKNLHVQFLKAFSGLFQKRVIVYEQPRSYYFLDFSPSVMGNSLSSWIGRQVVLVPKKDKMIRGDDSTCMIQSGEVESLIRQVEIFLDGNYSQK